MRLIYLIALLLLMQGCATHKNSCIDYRKVGGKAEQYKHPKKGRIVGAGAVFHFESIVKELEAVDSESEGQFDDYPLTASVANQPVIIRKQDVWEKRVGHKFNLDSLSSAVKTDFIVPADTVITLFDQNYRKAKSLGIISLLSGIASVFALAAPVLIIPLALLSFITGAVSLKKFRKSLRKNYRALPIIGIILSSVMIAIIILAIILLILFWTQF